MQIKEKELQMFLVARASGVRLWFLWSQHGISLVVNQDEITFDIFCPFFGIFEKFLFQNLVAVICQLAFVTGRRNMLFGHNALA